MWPRSRCLSAFKQCAHKLWPHIVFCSSRFHCQLARYLAYYVCITTFVIVLRFLTAIPFCLNRIKLINLDKFDCSRVIAVQCVWPDLCACV